MMKKRKNKKRKMIRLRLRPRLRGIYLNRTTEKVNGYLSSCVPVGRGWEGENQDILSSKYKIKKSGKLSVLKLKQTTRERERERELEICKCMLKVYYVFEGASNSWKWRWSWIAECPWEVRSTKLLHAEGNCSSLMFFYNKFPRKQPEMQARATPRMYFCVEVRNPLQTNQ